MERDHRLLETLDTSMPDISMYTPIRRRPLACIRCRRRKVRCDGGLPACSNCSKAGVECLEGRAESTVSRNRLHYLENRVRELEAASDHRGQPDPSGSSPLAREPELSPHPWPVQHQASSEPNHVRQDSSARPRPPSVARVDCEHNSNDNNGSSHDRIPPAESPAASASTRITHDQPLAHQVGLISLSNTTDPKYLGPSSGVTFARLIYESAPQSQGLPLAYLREQEQRQDARPAGDGSMPGSLLRDAPPIDLPSMADCQQYAEAYFAATAFFPFISQDSFYDLLIQVRELAKTSNWNSRLPARLAAAQVLLVLSMGARFLETKLNSNFSSRDLFLAGMTHCTHVSLQDSIEGVQILLLLVLHSFYNPDGLNAWYLLHTILASCLDLGLQRRDSHARNVELESHRRTPHLRSAVFWSAYSLDRTLTTILGRPLTLRDEAIDQDFPGLEGSEEVERAAIHWHPPGPSLSKDQIEPPVSYIACVYSLRFDRIVAEIKLMIYRVSRSPSRFPWPENVTSWQQETEKACLTLLREVQSRQRGRPGCAPSPLSGTTVQNLELKFHQCMILLFRPSPQIPNPTLGAIEACFTSAMEIIRIHSELHRFSNLECSWLSTHSIFVAAITMLYCLWTRPSVRGSTSMNVCLSRAEMALQLLAYLSQWWSVAQEPCQKLSRLITLTREGWNSQGQGLDNNSVLNPGHPEDLGRDHAEFPGQDRSLLIDELGILRDLFDLGWLSDSGLDIVSAPAWDSSHMSGNFENPPEHDVTGVGG